MNHLPIHLFKFAAALLLVGLQCLSSAHAQETACGSFENNYGPYDYRTDRDRLPIVDKHHFFESVRALTFRVDGTGTLAGHLQYVLRAFPNHHPALATIVRYGQRMKSRKPPEFDYSIDCYFERALRFRRDDYIARLLFADYLGKTGRANEAVEQIGYAKSLSKDNPLTQYNIGMLYFELGRYDDALKQAHEAMAMGMSNPELKTKLVSIGRWAEPAPTPAASAASQ